MSPLSPLCPLSSPGGQCPLCPLYVPFTDEHIVRTSSRPPHFAEHPFLNQVIEIPGRSFLDCLREFLIVEIADALVGMDVIHRDALAVIEIQCTKRGGRQPCAPDGHGKCAAALFEIRLGQAGLATTIDHIEGTGAECFSVVRPEQRFGNQRIARNRGVFGAQFFECQVGRQFSRIPDFEPVGKQHDLHSGSWRCSRGAPRR